MAHQAPTTGMTEEEFDRHVMGILACELDPGGLDRFIMTFRSGEGDYTRQRQLRQDAMTPEEKDRQLAEIAALLRSST